MNTVEVKTSELADVALDWVVAKCEGHKINVGFRNLTYTPKGKRTLYAYRPSTNWAQAGPIIEREQIGFRPPCTRRLVSGAVLSDKSDGWFATIYTECPDGESLPNVSRYGQTALIAAMRCYVASKFGDTVQIPAELMSK